MDEVRILKAQLKDGRVAIVYDTVAKKAAMKELNKHVDAA